MEFYKSISDYYREVFPVKPQQVDFVLDAFTDPSTLSLLDVGCGTGDLTQELSTSFNQITGIDLDVGMLEIARKSTPGNVEYQSLNMLDIGKRLGVGTYDGILCFGNTLVHISEPENISAFIHQAHTVLADSGKLLIQIINYDRILDQKIKALPTIESDHCSFERLYHYDSEKHQVYFETILTIKKRGESIRNRIPLYPLRKAEIDKMLKEAGFTDIRYFGNFKRDSLAKGSLPLVVEASS